MVSVDGNVSVVEAVFSPLDGLSRRGRRLAASGLWRSGRTYVVIEIFCGSSGGTAGGEDMIVRVAGRCVPFLER